MLVLLMVHQKGLYAQDFINGDLEGTISVTSVPPNWVSVPDTDPASLASGPGFAIPDICGLTGPNIGAGINGNPYSDTSFVSGQHSLSFLGDTFHEGIQQTLSGFNTTVVYNLNFYQTVVKQSNLLDESGSWEVYIDNTLLGTTAVSTSTLPYNSNNLNWDFRTFSFQPTSGTHTFKFLPVDDDLNITSSTSDINGGLRMGIDSIHLIPILSCAKTLDIGNDTILCQGDSVTIDITGFDLFNFMWSDSVSVDSSFTINTDSTGWYWVQADSSLCSYRDSIFVEFVLDTLNLGNDTTLCATDSLVLDATTPGATYLWFDSSTDSVFVAQQADTIWVEITVGNCTYSDTIVVDFISGNSTFLGNDTLICTGASVDIETQLYGSSYLWSDGTTDSVITISTPDTVWLDVTSGGCIYSDTIVVDYYPVPIVDLGNDTTLCDNDTLNLDVTTANATYLWSDGSTNPTFQVSTVDTVWVDVTQNGCTYSDTIIVGYITPIVIDLGNDTTLCQGAGIILDATTAGASYLWPDLSTNATLSVNQPDTVWVNVTDASCTYTDTIIIDYFAANDTFLGPDTFFCVGTSIDIETQLYGSSYLWNDGSTDSVITVTMADTLWLDVTVGTCIYTDTIIVDYYPVPPVNLGNDTTLCQGDSLYLDVTTNNATYLWSDNSTNATLEVSTADTVWVNVMQNGCTYTDTIIVDYFTPLTVDLGNDTILCQQADITLDATCPAGAGYLWPDMSTNPTLLVTQADTVWVNVTDANCTYTDTIIIDYYPANDTFLGPDTAFCYGASIDIETQLYGSSYLWSDGSTDSLITLTVADTVWLAVTVGDCVYSDTIEVNYFPLLNIDLGNDTTLCQGESITLDATTAGASYLWSDNSTGATLTLGTEDTIWVDVSLNGCTYRDSIIINYFTASTVDLGNDTTLCPGADITLDATFPGATYEWFDLSTNPTLLVTQADTVWVDISDANCTYSDTIIIDYYPALTVDLGNDTSLCDNDSLEVSVSFTNANYSWSTGSIDNKIVVYSTDQIWIDVMQYGCMYSDTINVQFNNLPVVDLGNDTSFCEGGSVNLDALNPGATYEWQDLSPNQTYNVTVPGNYWVTVTDANDCVASDTVDVAEIIIDVDLGPDLVLCDGEIQNFDVTQTGATYLWQDNSGLSSYTVSTPDLYSVVVTIDQCSDSDEVFIDYVYVDAAFSVQSNACIGDEVQFTNLSTVSANDAITEYIWHFGDNSSVMTLNNPSHVYVTSGNTSVTLIASSGNGCVDTADLQNIITIYSNPNADFSYSPEEIDELNPVVQFTNESDNELHTSWIFDDFGVSGEENPLFNFPESSAGVYPVTLAVIDGNGCVDTIVKDIYIRENVIYYVPNAFTPTAGSYNTVFQPVFTDGFDPYSYHLTIFNKWGELVFESFNPDIGWDGTYNNQVVELGVYIWKIDFEENLESEKHTAMGHVTVLR